MAGIVTEEAPTREPQETASAPANSEDLTYQQALKQIQAREPQEVVGRRADIEELSYKVRISVLWALGMIAFFAYRTIAVSEGVTEVSVLSNNELASVLAIMMAFALLSLLLLYPANRLMNIIAGAIFSVMELIMLGDGVTAYPSHSFNIMTGAAVVFMASIVWLAIRWPQRQP